MEGHLSTLLLCVTVNHLRNLWLLHLLVASPPVEQISMSTMTLTILQLKELPSLPSSLAAKAVPEKILFFKIEKKKILVKVKICLIKSPKNSTSVFLGKITSNFFATSFFRFGLKILTASLASSSMTSYTSRSDKDSNQ